MRILTFSARALEASWTHMGARVPCVAMLTAVLALTGPAAHARSEEPTLAPIFVDLDGDTDVSGDEIRAQIYQQARKILEAHAYGWRDPEGLRQSLVRLAFALYGDLDASQAVDLQDVVLLLTSSAEGGATLADGDLYVDGVIDAADALALVPLLGQSVPLTDDEALIGLLVFVVEYEEGMDGPARSAGYPDGHIVVISDTWPPPFGFPPQDLDWPPNHYGTISMDSISPGDWPPNHLSSVSPTWDPGSHISMESEYTGHDPTTSATYPSNHNTAVSGTWPEMPPHAQSTSTLWGPGHRYDQSSLGDPTLHVGYLSQLWPHDTAVTSTRWPSNHLSDFSQTWTGHDTAISLEWPGSHHSVVSDSWPDPTRHWPPNHATSQSVTWSEPQNHKVTDSILTDPSNPFRLPRIPSPSNP